MKRVELVAIEDTFEISGGVVVIPDFSVPNTWTNRSETVVIARPDGQQFDAVAQFTIAHFNIPDPKVPLDKRWRIVVRITDRTKAELPIGSKILVAQEVRDALLPKNSA